ncbi:hypothetical protein EDF62_2058 [Leucobacter luti]|uniref:Uncharacterized protein n=1 Tax=Leucobacter luti TaxID=340320 RepID=A0A4R6RWL6_9MICO|nr:hypothetical protein [Leucobacter luti]TDP91442.1 hypothetical protein EDF62_2058 [Leucobacter luti]
MTHSLPPRDPQQRFTSHQELAWLLNGLLQPAVRQQFWLFLFDAEHRLRDPIIPFEGLPADPHEVHETSDMGRVPFATVLLQRIAWVSEVAKAASMVGVWERPGPERFTATDLRWAQSIAHGAGETAGVPRVRSLFVLHDTGLRLIAPDDYI